MTHTTYCQENITITNITTPSSPRLLTSIPSVFLSLLRHYHHHHDKSTPLHHHHKHTVTVTIILSLLLRPPSLYKRSIVTTTVTSLQYWHLTPFHHHYLHLYSNYRPSLYQLHCHNTSTSPYCHTFPANITTTTTPVRTSPLRPSPSSVMDESPTSWWHPNRTSRGRRNIYVPRASVGDKATGHEKVALVVQQHSLPERIRNNIAGVRGCDVDRIYSHDRVRQEREKMLSFCNPG